MTLILSSTNTNYKKKKTSSCIVSLQKICLEEDKCRSEFVFWHHVSHAQKLNAITALWTRCFCPYDKSGNCCVYFPNNFKLVHAGVASFFKK